VGPTVVFAQRDPNISLVAEVAHYVADNIFRQVAGAAQAAHWISS
jgi:hypothetical protein